MARRCTVTKRNTAICSGLLVDPDLVSDNLTFEPIFNALLTPSSGFPAIVTRFYLQTLPKFTHMRSSAYIYEKKDYRKAFQWILDVSLPFAPTVP